MTTNKKIVYCLRLPKDTDTKVKDVAKRQGISQNAFIMNAINKELDKAKKREA